MIMKNLIKITLTTLMLAGLLSTTNAASITDKCNTGVACYELIDRNAVTAMEGYKIGSAYNDNNSLDLNHDSIKDVLYEYVDNGHYELVDRNFDGKIDASYFFDTDYLIVKSREDDDFDNFLESVTFYKYSLGVITTVDSDLDDFTDIIFLEFTS